MPTTYDSVSGAPVYNFPTETKEDFDAINKPQMKHIDPGHEHLDPDDDGKLRSMHAELENVIRRWELYIEEHPANDKRSKILVAMRELADWLKSVVTPNSVPEANTD